MGTGRTLNRAPMTRPRKSEGDRLRRFKIHKQRLTALGVPDETLKHLTILEARELLRVPERTRKTFSA